MCYLDFESFTTRNFAVVSDQLCTQCGISAGLSIIESAETFSLSFPISIVGSHAKFCVIDGESAYIGSANLTSPGLSS